MTVRNYAILYVGGKRTRGGTVVGGGTIVEGGNGVLETEPHALDGLEHTNRDSYTKAINGGEEGYLDHGTVGATETIDPADGNAHTITLDDDCTLTLGATVDDKFCSLVVEVIQDVTGGWTIDLPASVANGADVETGQDTTAGLTSFLTLITRDSGTTWYGFWAGSSGAGVTYGTPALTLGTANAAGATDEAIRRDATILAFDATAPTTQAFGDTAVVGVATVAARRDHKHAMPAVSSSGAVGAILITDTPAGSPLVFADLLQNEAQDDLVYADP